MSWLDRREIKPTLEKRPLAEALAIRYPELSASQLLRLEEALLREISTAIARGNALAILKPGEDGTLEISHLVVDRAANAVARQG
ncbi:hypothetical protein [Frankia sp. Cj3]|uniref:hypothetical protein n=1 Tax=Frankia sp. Cj3 TaxID=2880976 RepID=UPI001EF42039|nr:hypothetical protein [Frankia sp. Cj3]